MRIDWQQARALVATQLRIDLRHPKTGAARTSRALLTVAAYGCSSLLVALSLWSSNADVDAALFVGLSFATVLGAFSVAGAYDDLMGRPKDHAWALAFPVAERTHYVARLMNIGVLAFLAAGATALPLAALVGVLQGPAAAFGAGAAFVVALLGTTAAVLAALWVLTLATPYRLLRPAIAGLRGLLVVALVIGYQWVGTQEALVVEAAWWPAWWLLQGLWHADPAALVVLATAGAVLLALFGFAFPDRYFRLLRTLADGEAARQTRPRSHAAPNRLERLLVREPAARAAYGLTVAALRADRIVRGRAWPSAALALAFAAFAWWMGGLGDLFLWGAESVLYESAVQMHLSVLVILLFVAQTLVQAVQCSDCPEAAWTLDALPVRSPRPLQVGAQQALLLRLLLPLHVALALVLSLEMSVLHAGLHAGFWFAACALVSRVQALVRRRPPFAQGSDRFSMTDRFGPLLLAVPASLGFLLLQSVAFVSETAAALMVAGLLVLHAALGRLAFPAARVAPAVLPAVVVEPEGAGR